MASTLKILSSTLDKWIDRPATSWHAMVHLSNQYESAYSAAKEVNRLLVSAPKEVGGEIAINITENQLNDLRRKRVLFSNFADSIHYEIADLVDNPYTFDLENVIKSAYELDPMNFKTDNKLFGNSASSGSLATLISSTINDFLTRLVFNANSMVLDVDEESEDVKNTISAAKFWQREFKKSDEVQKIASKFIKANETSWNKKSPEEKLKLLNQYCNDVGNVLNECSHSKENNGDGIGLAVKYASQDPYYSSSSQALGYVYANLNGTVYIHDDYGKNDPSFDLCSAINTITHEVRHQFQEHAISEKDTYNIPTDLETNWSLSYEEHPEYWTRPIEVDARAFAGFSATY